MHSYRIHYRAHNRTTRRMHRRMAHARARTRWGALRAWWTIQRQWANPWVEVLSVELDHRGCPKIDWVTHWEYICTHA